MRLNVELCDASEAVEKLDYRWKLKKETEKGKWEEHTVQLLRFGSLY